MSSIIYLPYYKEHNSTYFLCIDIYCVDIKEMKGKNKFQKWKTVSKSGQILKFREIVYVVENIREN